MPSRSKYNCLGSEAEEEGMVDVSSDSDDSELEADRAMGSDDVDHEYVGESSDAGRRQRHAPGYLYIIVHSKHRSTKTQRTEIIERTINKQHKV
jgi:hypothetical protein